ncbi:MAG: Zn-ribbon domain-containing OB-fold protein [bacterium]
MSDRLAPTTTPDTKFFWEALQDNRLLVQRCTGCAALRHPPRPMCPRCNSLAWDTVESSGRGVVYSFVLPRHPPWPWFEGTYIVALIEMEDGTRMISNLCDVEADAVTIGMPVQAFIEHFDNGVSLPQFRPRREEG